MIITTYKPVLRFMVPNGDNWLTSSRILKHPSFASQKLRAIRSRLEQAFDCGCGWGDYCGGNDDTQMTPSCLHNMVWVQDQLLA